MVVAEQWVSSGVAAVAIASVPLWSVLFAGLWGRWPAKGEWIGLAIGLAGVALLQSGGLSPQVDQGTWLSNAIKAITPGSQKKPEAKPEPAPSPGMPAPEDLPAPRVPSDVPVSSAPSKPPLGLAQNQSTQWQPEVRR